MNAILDCVKPRASVVFYHADCNDGMAAAWAMSTKLGSDGVEYVPVHYAEKEWLGHDVRDKAVYFVDFCPPRKDLVDMCALADTVTVLDHHKSAQADMDLSLPWAPPNLNLVFDMTKSGARLAWEFANPGTEAPALIKYVEDSDLWKFQYHQTKAVRAALSMKPRTIETYAAVAATLVSPMAAREFLDFGQAVLDVRQFDTTKTIERLARRRDNEGRVYLFGNVIDNISEVGNQALLANPDVQYTMTYFDTIKADHVIRAYSLRSTGDFDVSVIAKASGGGGHKNAAGFTETRHD